MTKKYAKLTRNTFHPADRNSEYVLAQMCILVDNPMYSLEEKPGKEVNSLWVKCYIPQCFMPVWAVLVSVYQRKQIGKYTVKAESGWETVKFDHTEFSIGSIKTEKGTSRWDSM